VVVQRPRPAPGEDHPVPPHDPSGVGCWPVGPCPFFRCLYERPWRRTRATKPYNDSEFAYVPPGTTNHSQIIMSHFEADPPTQKRREMGQGTRRHVLCTTFGVVSSKPRVEKCVLAAAQQLWWPLAPRGAPAATQKQRPRTGAVCPLLRPPVAHSWWPGSNFCMWDDDRGHSTRTPAPHEDTEEESCRAWCGTINMTAESRPGVPVGSDVPCQGRCLSAPRPCYRHLRWNLARHNPLSDFERQKLPTIDGRES